MVINPRSAVGIAAIWLVAVAGVSATAWYAIDRAGRDITDASAGALPPAPLTTPTLASEPTTSDAAPQPSATPTPTTIPIPSPTPSHSVAPSHPAIPRRSGGPAPRGTASPPATPADQSINVSGGLVAVRCTGATIALRVAQPLNGWRVHVDTSSAGQIVVSFQMGDEESQSRTEVTAVCANGTPAFQVSNR